MAGGGSVRLLNNSLDIAISHQHFDYLPDDILPKSYPFKPSLTFSPSACGLIHFISRNSNTGSAIKLLLLAGRFILSVKPAVSDSRQLAISKVVAPGKYL